MVYDLRNIWSEDSEDRLLSITPHYWLVHCLSSTLTHLKAIWASSLDFQELLPSSITSHVTRFFLLKRGKSPSCATIGF